MTASGTSGHGAELGAFGDLSSLGAVTVKSLLPTPWAGNAPVRVHQSPSGMINSVGLQGPGIEAWRARDLPALIATGAAVVVSIWGRSVDEYAEGAALVADLPDEVVALEVNISCPNTEKGNELFAHSADATRAVMSATAAANRPRWAKLSPNAGPLLVRRGPGRPPRWGRGAHHRQHLLRIERRSAHPATPPRQRRRRSVRSCDPPPGRSSGRRGSGRPAHRTDRRRRRGENRRGRDRVRPGGSLGGPGGDRFLRRPPHVFPDDHRDRELVC